MKRGPDKQFDPEVALQKAAEVFQERGYEAASLAELTSAMGIGKKSMYDTFGNKRALFLQALRYYAQSNVAELRRALFKPGSSSTLENIQNLLAKLLEQHSACGSKGCLMGTNIADFDTSDEEVAAALRRSLKYIEDAFEEAVEKAAADGEILLEMSARHVARTLVCLMQGIALVGRVMESGEILGSAIEVTRTQILRPA